MLFNHGSLLPHGQIGVKLKCIVTQNFTFNSLHLDEEAALYRVRWDANKYVQQLGCDSLMKVGVCAWGSLLWDPRNLKLQGDFLPIGPCLPLEFSRISGLDERRRLTLVIDEENGAPCQSFVAQSAFRDIGDAIDNLAVREGLYYKEDVGWAASGAASTRALSRHPSAVRGIQEFLDQSDFDAIIWTALPSNFAACLPDGSAFSVPRALRVLSDDFSQSEWCASIEYMRRAPPGVITPLRAVVEGAAGVFARRGGGS